jgi:hypothetical protein
MSSQVLASHISESVNQQQDKLVIDDFEAHVIQKMLEFIYDDTANLSVGIYFLEKILKAAGKYEIEKLKVRII